ncbi:hypothetical protein X777_13072 [Ooceraea biroi]|uniref:Uncharacterized protein n=1 Tax=Ooceraea biroi TaxID=2015173 RepID=A0A026WXS4_OOCBI|nr:hypothetical protein X777_13072 [Ooceraea biroi]
MRPEPGSELARQNETHVSNNTASSSSDERLPPSSSATADFNSFKAPSRALRQLAY